MTQTKKDIIIGILIGIFTAFLISFIIFLNTNPGLSTADYFNVFVYGKIIAPILSMALLGNLAVFFLFLKLNKDLISKGILVATIIVGILVFIIKFIL
ncbi:MAG: hypothetical protein Q8K70_03020 [Bacteroidota bacterium]|nr:hypothetical protein [Bacteroidota bacterium]